MADVIIPGPEAINVRAEDPTVQYVRPRPADNHKVVRRRPEIRVTDTEVDETAEEQVRVYSHLC